jgi:hypothetical protein
MLGGQRFAHSFGTNNTFLGASAGNTVLTGTNNTGVGASALLSSTTGGFNSAFGVNALQFNTMGGSNAAFGINALQFNTTGNNNAAFGESALNANTASGNSAFGQQALFSNTTGSLNSAFGLHVLFSNTTGSNNAAFGDGALFMNTGGQNSAFGGNALQNLGAGSSNTAVGAGAGGNLLAGNGNIYIGNAGVNSESNIIRIGASQTATFVAGISGATSASGVAVLVNGSGLLGTTTSSRRFKDDIADMAGESDLLMKLRPVAFYYKPELDETHTRQYGLVAEDVAKVAPQLVVFDKDGVPETVRYHFVNAMLLNEVQKQRSTIAQQQAQIQDLAARLAKLEALVAPTP